ncbi:EscU/YscU/HrcU family type III secretion system export apparatus switch protein [Neobacillus muris]|uniref:EscU/YscU/HrcU family type III secretion system export apparatus switch protein n=1 Tax=Neobacillus muris TaxID=2941334 RepID=UPI00203CD9DE|nr:EscU/YscU/HrcU family type III secretion system export apparatus switch protein [Neobacillus muris]
MTKNLKRTLQAVALSYDAQTHDAPKVTAKGNGELASKIIEAAKEHNVPIQEDPSLVELLSRLQINEVIPEQLYQAVAEIFAFIYKVDQNLGDGSKSLNNTSK